MSVMMTLQILKCVDSTKTRKSKYLENKVSYFFIKKIHSLYIKGYSMAIKITSGDKL